MITKVTTATRKHTETQELTPRKTDRSWEKHAETVDNLNRTTSSDECEPAECIVTELRQLQFHSARVSSLFKELFLGPTYFTE